MSDGIDFIDKYERPMANTDASAEQLAKNKQIVDKGRIETLKILAESKRLRDTSGDEKIRQQQRLQQWKEIQAKDNPQQEPHEDLVGAAEGTSSQEPDIT